MKLGSTLVATSVLVVVCAAVDLDPIVIKGSKFFYKTNGTEFFMRGIAYQEDYLGGAGNGTGGTNYHDPLADQTACARDVPLMAQLRTNTIRVYAIDPTKNHDRCMQMLADAGIYVVADLGEPLNSINRDSPQWNQVIYQRYTAVVDNLSKYTNTLGFFAGNEVTNMANNTEASAFVKAAVRDVKAYIVQKKYRPLGVGYASNDDSQRTELANYFNCGDPSAAIDFWGFNIYSWCGTSSYRESQYQERTREFSTYNVPVFFAEYGCNTEGPREFDEVQALYGNEMTKVWSGGIVYMYYQETNDYGLVSVGSDDKATLLPDYTALSSQMAKVTPSGVTMSAYAPTNRPQSCPEQDSAWSASEKLPPSPNNAVCSCMVQSLNCTANPDISDDDLQTNFDYLCDPNNGNYCSGILANGTTGVYGAYSMCNPEERISWAFNAFFMDQTKNNPKNTDPCNFKGAAKKQTAKANGDCRNVVNQAGDAGTGTITGAPAATGGGSGGSGGSSSDTTGAASALIVPGFNAGMLWMAAYITVAGLIGASMVVL
ncbi:MAG: hypothetical protein Q9221_001190 [Calogaya cf. arnoldii]